MEEFTAGENRKEFKFEDLLITNRKEVTDVKSSEKSADNTATKTEDKTAVRDNTAKDKSKVVNVK